MEQLLLLAVALLEEEFSSKEKKEGEREAIHLVSSVAAQEVKSIKPPETTYWAVQNKYIQQLEQQSMSCVKRLTWFVCLISKNKAYPQFLCTSLRDWLYNIDKTLGMTPSSNWKKK